MTPDLERMQRRMDIALGRPLDRYGIPSRPEPQVIRFYDPGAAARLTADGRRILADMTTKFEAHCPGMMVDAAFRQGTNEA